MGCYTSIKRESQPQIHGGFVLSVLLTVLKIHWQTDFRCAVPPFAQQWRPNISKRCSPVCPDSALPLPRLCPDSAPTLPYLCFASTLPLPPGCLCPRLGRSFHCAVVAASALRGVLPSLSHDSKQLIAMRFPVPLSHSVPPRCERSAVCLSPQSGLPFDLARSSGLCVS
jgi:hypothetical protein